MRISRDRDDETSTTTQRAAVEAWCALKGHTVVDVVVEPGRSAYKASRSSRPGFRRAMDLIKTNAADMLVVWKVDRACRNALDLLTLVRDLDELGAAFASATEEFDTSTPMGKAMLTIVGALAELESAQKSERATEWHRHRRLTGAVPAGRPALGYRKPQPNKLEPDPEVAPLVRRAAEAIAGGESLLSQVRMLADHGVKVSHVGLRTALRSPTLAGLAAASEQALERRAGARILDGAELIEGDWEPILDRDLWERVRAVLDAPDRRTNRSNELRYPLVPLVRCHCGGRMNVHVDRSARTPFRRLICRSCATGIAYDPVEEAVTAAVLDALDDTTWNDIRAHGQAQPVDTAEAEERLARMWSMVLDGKIEPEEYAEAKARWAGEQVAASTPTADLPNVADVRTAWPTFTADERLIVLRAAIRRLVIRPATRRGRGVDLERVDLETV